MAALVVAMVFTTAAALLVAVEAAALAALPVTAGMLFAIELCHTEAVNVAAAAAACWVPAAAPLAPLAPPAAGAVTVDPDALPPVLAAALPASFGMIWSSSLSGSLTSAVMRL